VNGSTQVPDGIADGARIPLWIRLVAPVFEWWLAAGMWAGPNGLITIRGRTSGRPRTNGVAIVEISGRRWVWCPWGEPQWVHNLRAAQRATITKGRRKVEVTATELDPQERVAFHRDFLGPKVRSIPFGRTFIRIVDGVDVNRPEEAAKGRPVFELRRMQGEIVVD
jgi:deazaflavin-dependent oxidoreductase (nitroreductase family)